MPHFSEFIDPNALPLAVLTADKAGASYTYAYADKGVLVTHSSASAKTGTLPSAVNLGAGWFVYAKNTGAGLLTISPAVGTIDSLASVRLQANEFAVFVTSGSNWVSQTTTRAATYPASAIGTGTLSAADAGLLVTATGALTIPNAIMPSASAVTIYNSTAASIVLTASITLLTQAGTGATGNRTLAAKGLARIIFLSGTSALIDGVGIT